MLLNFLILKEFFLRLRKKINCMLKTCNLLYYLNQLSQYYLTLKKNDRCKDFPKPLKLFENSRFSLDFWNIISPWGVLLKYIKKYYKERSILPVTFSQFQIC